MLSKPRIRTLPVAWTRRLVITALATVQLLFLTNACADELLINGDFESPAIAADSFEITNPDSWAGTGDIRIFNGNYGSPGFPGPVNGQQYRSEERRVGKECRSRWS